MNGHEEPEGHEAVPADPVSEDRAVDEPAFEDPAFDDPAFDDLRGLLADSRVTEPIPSDVAARLDETLASLHAARDAERQPVVVPLRRRLAPRVLAAAVAAVVVGAGGVGITQIARDSSSSSADKAATAGSANSDAGADSATPSAPVQPERTPQLSGAARPQLTKTAFADDAARLMRTLAGTGSTLPDATDGSTGEKSGLVPAAPPVTSPERPTAAQGRDLAVCPGPAVTGGVTLPADLDGSPVALVFRTPTASAQRVEAWSCDGSMLLASATVPR